MNAQEVIDAAARNAEDSEAIAEAAREISEENELLKGELRAYRAALAHMSEEAQLISALEIAGVDPEQRKRVLKAMRRIKEIL